MGDAEGYDTVLARSRIVTIPKAIPPLADRCEPLTRQDLGQRVACRPAWCRTPDGFRKRMLDGGSFPSASYKAFLQRIAEIGAAYRRVLGRHFPAMTLVQVAALLDDRAKVEIEATAVVPTLPVTL